MLGEQEMKVLKTIALLEVVKLSTLNNLNSVVKKLVERGLVRIVQHKHTDYIAFVVITEKGKELACKI